jgi:hypothetical protein
MPLTLIKDLGRIKPKKENKHNYRRGIFRCSVCNQDYEMDYYHGISGKVKQCQRCSNIEIFTTHGGRHTSLYPVWQSMKDRCNNPNNSHYSYYGGKGITVCKEWNSDFETFQSWAKAHGYRKCLTIDRIDSDGNYEPCNCRWVDYQEQAYNRDKFKNNTSGYTGVCLRRVNTKGIEFYESYLNVNKTRVTLGYYNSAKEAVEARNKYIKENNLPHPIQEYKETK